MSSGATTPSVCGSTHLIDDQGQPIRLTCSALPGHPGLCQAYWRDRLHEWTPTTTQGG